MTHVRKLLEAIGDRKKVYIQMHNSPDPDALASAFSLQQLLKYYDVESIICYRGIIERYNTQTMIKLLSIEAFEISEIKDMKENDYIILVDSQKGNSNVMDFIGDEIAAIDHHPISSDIEYKYSDIREEVGACASIIASYYSEENIEMSAEAATAIIYGIKMDTLDFSRGSNDLDLEVFYKLFSKIDSTILKNIQLNSLEFSDLVAYSNAIKAIKVFDNIGFANIGYDCPDCLLGSVSDFILSLKEVDFAVVYSPKPQGIKFSIRNETEKYHAGRIIDKALIGIGSGGGHKDMAGGFVPRAKIAEVEKEMDSFFENRFMEELGLK